MTDTVHVSVGPSADVLLTVEQREQYLLALRLGIAPGLAARSLEVPELTGTRLRACRKRDRVFAAECDAAIAEGHEHYRERLSATARNRALAVDGGSDRILEVELATHVPGYGHLRRDRLVVDAKVEHAIVFDPAVLEAMPLERLVEFRAFLSELGGGVVVDGEFTVIPELPEGNTDGPE